MPGAELGQTVVSSFEVLLTFDLATSMGRLPTKIVRRSLSSFVSSMGTYALDLVFCFLVDGFCDSWTSSVSLSDSTSSAGAGLDGPASLSAGVVCCSERLSGLLEGC